MALRAGGLTGLMNQPSAQVIDGSLKFDKDKSQRLEFTPSVSGNRRTWTISYWYKNNNFGNTGRQFQAGTSDPDFFLLGYHSDGYIQCTEWSTNWFRTGALLRDTGWYHIVLAWDSTQSTNTERWKFYINGVLQTAWTDSGSHLNYPSQNDEDAVNKASVVHQLGSNTANSQYTDGAMAQVYFIDGQQLDASYFGFTDPLTNTWRPKKYINTTASPGDAAGVVGFGTNGFYLPFDGNSPIGQDKSGQGNNWTPVNFGGSNSIEKATGAKPILNTGNGGNIARPGVFGSEVSKYYTILGTSGSGNPYIFEDLGNQPQLSFIRGATYTFDWSAASSHPLRFATAADAAGGTEYTDGTDVTGNVTSITVPHDAPDTLYYYCNVHGGMGNSISVTTDETKADPYAWKNVLALPLVGGANDVSNRINSGSTAKTVSVSGDPASSTIESNFYGASFYFDGSANTDYVSVADNDQLDVGSGDFTIECWAYVSGYPNTNPGLLSKRGGNGAAHWQLVLNRNGQIQFGDQATWSNYFGTSSGTTGDQIFKDNWHHIAITRTSGSVQAWYDGREYGTAITNTTNFSTSANFSVGVGREDNYDPFQGYVSDVRVYKGISKYTSNFVVPSTNPDILPDTPSSVSGSSKLTKITDGAVSFDGANDYLTIADSDDFNLGSGAFTIEGFCYLNNSNAQQFLVGQWTDSQLSYAVQTTNDSNRNLRFLISNDGSTVNFDKGGSGLSLKLKGWSHFAVTRSGNTFYLFVDGILVGTQSDSNTLHNSTGTLAIGARNDGTQDLNGFISNVRIVKGTALYTSNFTPPTRELTDVTNTKLLCCQSNTSATAAAVTPGTITAVGDAAATTFNPFNTDINTVRGQETGYATLNPLVSTVSLSDGNLHQSQTSGTWNVAVSSIPMSTGKWYCEVTIETSNEFQIGIVKLDDGPNWVANFPIVDFEYGWGMIADASNGTGRLRSDYITPVNGQTNQAYGPFSPTAGDTISMAYDADNQTLTYFVNGINFGDTTSIWAYPPTAGEYVFANSVTTNTDVLWNFGQKPFKFPPPDGFQPLNTANIRPETVIARPNQYVGITTWKGDDQASHIINDLNFDGVPDFVWIKRRDGNASSHQLYDTIRGATKPLVSNASSSEDTQTSGLIDFVRGGFELGASSVVNGLDGDNGNVPFNYVAWCWKAGGNSNTFNIDDVGYASAAAAGLDGGNKTPTGASVGTKQGFSIIKFTNDSTSPITLSHGLTQAPTFVLLKALTGSVGWTVGHTSIGFTKRLKLNGTDAESASANYFNDTAPTSSLITLGANNVSNDFIMYSWHDVPGLQKFGKYEGNQNADGTYVELGFRPALIWVKNIDNSSGHWIIVDKERDKTNPLGTKLATNLGNGDFLGGSFRAECDFLSNGFKMRGNSTDSSGMNKSDTYVYCAWAEAPTVNLYGGGANAR